MSQVYKPTIGADFHSKRLEVIDSNNEKRMVTMQIWDTAGQERFQSLGRAFYRGAEACVLVYDVTNEKSFDNLQAWKQEFLNKAMPNDPQSVPFFIFGNKYDLEDEIRVSDEKLQDWKNRNPEFTCYEVSALTGANVEEGFT